MSIFLLIAGVVSAGGTSFDYCSIPYSEIVRQEIDGYFLEVFRGFDVPLSKTCPFANLDYTSAIYNLKTYDSKKTVQYSKVECSSCGKVFKNEEYLEWHLWTQHQDSPVPETGAVCLSDFCDIIPCNRRKNRAIEPLLKKTMAVQRKTQDESLITKDDDHRGLLAVYDRNDLMRLEARCSKLILDCIDWSSFN